MAQARWTEARRKDAHRRAPVHHLRNHLGAAADNSFWVDPRTGIVIDIEQRVLSVLRGPGGRGKLVVADMDLRMSGSSRHQLAALASKNAALIRMLRETGPLGGGLLGLVLILAAVIPFRLRGRAAVRSS